MPRRHRTGPRAFVAALAATTTLAAGIALVAPGQAGAGLDPSVPQEPFLCTTEGNGLGQPIVDNTDHVGTPVYPETTPGTPDRSLDPIGWSEQCQADTVVEYRYRATDGSRRTLAHGLTTLPADIAMLDVADMVGTDRMTLGGATQIPYLYRYERGTLPNTRFVYSIAMLVPFQEYLDGGDSGGPWDDDSYWNGRLLFSFGGGVGIGHSQGDLSSGDSQMHEALRIGHAVVYSSGTRTSTHYNLKLGARTAVELKDRFVTEHGDPLYTLGIGGSGGGIQQYVYAQNEPELLDALIPQYSYPDMTTQTINIGDCELLEHYMDVLDSDNPRWEDWDNRKIIQGQNTIEGFTSSWQARTGDTGSSECIEGWRGATPLAMNPTFGLAVGEDDLLLPYASELLTKISLGQPAVPDDFPDFGRLLRTTADPDDWVEWTHWADVAEVYGVDPATGKARTPWDNVGVQYGLRAVAKGQITPDEFIELNAKIGSWSTDNVPESCGMVEAMTNASIAFFADQIGMCEGSDLDQYSARQMDFSTDTGSPAPRREGDVAAITAAFESGLEFDGRLGRDIPILDVRHYLEEQLDMHNAHQSFVVRERIRRAMGNVDNHVIWFLDARPDVDDAATDVLYDQGFKVMDQWMLNKLANPSLTSAQAKPADAVDRCWDTDGTPIAAGDDVWSGAVELVTSGEGAWTTSAPTEVDGVPVGACAAHFPLNSTSRVVAGGPITNDVYKCHLKSVQQSIDDGDYGEWSPSAQEQATLEDVFPTGVCDWSQRSVGYPGAETPPTTTTTTTEVATTSSSVAATTTEQSAATTTSTDPDAGTLADGTDRNDDGSLPRTGSDVTRLLPLAALLLLLGAALVVRTRRRATDVG
ncbi:MAG: LPXTG cell wall anchor domain-containing protein [Actinobacteria bacterium]|nr:LPXTG cell wall anchor domain-containing protein [Actinomycetota bacterium]